MSKTGLREADHFLILRRPNDQNFHWQLLNESPRFGVDKFEVCKVPEVISIAMPRYEIFKI